MKQLLILIALFMVGCSHHKQLTKKYPDCKDYINYISENWKKKDNGFYTINEVKDTTLNEWQQLEAPPFFTTQWKKYVYVCLSKMDKKEVKNLFGKPTKIIKTFNVITKQDVEIYLYYISDGKCEEIIPKKNDKGNCGGISFTFSNGKANKYTKPTFFESGNNYFPIKK